MDDFFGNKNNNKVATETAGDGDEDGASASTSTSAQPKRKFLSTWMGDYEWLDFRWIIDNYSTVHRQILELT